MELETLCIHGGKVDTDKSGAISTPIYQTATYAHPALGQSTGYDYTRDTNPTRDALEAAMAKLEGGSAALAFASGMAAATALMEMFSPGDHIVASDDLYGGSWRLFHRISMKNGLSFDWADTSDPEKTEALIRPETKAIFIETPTNPLMHVTDIRAIARIARRHRILLIVDNTFLSPVFQRPLELGADIVLHSATKYLAGHNDTVAGILVCRTDELAEKLKSMSATHIGMTSFGLPRASAKSTLSEPVPVRSMISSKWYGSSRLIPMSMARARSAIRSSALSSPTERRSRRLVMPRALRSSSGMAAWVWVAG